MVNSRVGANIFSSEPFLVHWIDTITCAADLCWHATEWDCFFPFSFLFCASLDDDAGMWGHRPSSLLSQGWKQASRLGVGAASAVPWCPLARLVQASSRTPRGCGVHWKARHCDSIPASVPGDHCCWCCIPRLGFQGTRGIESQAREVGRAPLAVCPSPAALCHGHPVVCRH